MADLRLCLGHLAVVASRLRSLVVCGDAGALSSAVTVWPVSAEMGNVFSQPRVLYAHHLKLFWDYLTWAKLAWTDVGLGQLARFMAWLRRYDPDVVPLGEAKTRRRESTINTILAAVNSFYEFHERLGSLLPFERYRLGVRPSSATKPFLHHITKGQPVRTRLVKARSQRRLPRTLAPEDIEASAPTSATSCCCVCTSHGTPGGRWPGTAT